MTYLKHWEWPKQSNYSSQHFLFFNQFSIFPSPRIYKVIYFLKKNKVLFIAPDNTAPHPHPPPPQNKTREKQWLWNTERIVPATC